jgi:hypothetical protein
LFYHLGSSPGSLNYRYVIAEFAINCTSESLTKQFFAASSGLYLADADIAKEQPKPAAMDPDTAEKLWALSEKLVGQKFVW